MKTTIPLFSIVLAVLSVTVSPKVRATCQEGCLANGNTAFGDDALISNTNVAYDNTAIGSEALSSNTIGGTNTAIGFAALEDNTTGLNNTATGSEALLNNTTGNDNTAIGDAALVSNTTGNQNTATGEAALWYNTTGNDNTAIGSEALFPNTTGSKNTATGALALARNNTGFKNTAIGFQALFSNTTGENNIAVGQSAGVNLTTGNDNIDIGNAGVADEARTIRIGTRATQANAYIAGISGVTVPTGVAVIIDTTGHLGTVVSSERFKDNVQPMDKASEAILALKPVTFRYKKELDPKNIPQFGLVAEDVEKVSPDLVARDEQGKPYTVRYEAVNAMLLNEFLKEHRTVEELKKEIAALTATVKEQASQIRKVSADLSAASPSDGGLEAAKSSPQIVLNDQ
jgi:hypothetical protein